MLAFHLPTTVDKEPLNFIGIDDITSVYIEGHAYEPERANEILAAALAEVDGIAKTF